MTRPVDAYAEAVLAHLVQKVGNKTAARRILEENEAVVRKCFSAGRVAVHPRAAAGFLVIRAASKRPDRKS